jgi:hypothetical protein
MRPSDQFLLVTVRMLQAIRRECGLDQSMAQLMDRGSDEFLGSAEEKMQHRGKLNNALAEHISLASRMERDLPPQKLKELLSLVPPGSREAYAIREELALRGQLNGYRAAL